MKVLVLSSGELKEKDIDNTLEALQEIVEGYIEIPFLSERLYKHKIDIIINEEGKFIEGLSPEIAVIKEGTTNILDLVYGNCVFASHDEEGNTVALSDKQIKIVMEELKTDILLTNKEEGKVFFVKALFI
jgi:hypothetical protein